MFDALRLNLAAASTAVAGTLVALVLCDDSGQAGGRYEPTWIDGACVEGFTAGGFVYVAAATMRGIGEGEGWREVAATTGAIFFGTFACAAIHALGACDHGH